METGEGIQDTHKFHCAHCDHGADIGFKFCPKCGVQREIRTRVENPFKNKNLVSLLAYYFSTLFILILYKFTEEYLFGYVADMVIVHVLIAMLVIGFAIYNGRQSFDLGFWKLRLPTLALLILSTVGFAYVVNFVADFLNATLSDGYTFDFFAMSYPLILVIGLQCLFPAIFEELAFRGFLLDNIKALSNDRTAIGVSSFLFGIMHLGFIGLLWQIPIGILFAWLRIRYKTLWYGIIGHFIYNLVITLMERGIL